MEDLFKRIPCPYCGHHLNCLLKEFLHWVTFHAHCDYYIPHSYGCQGKTCLKCIISGMELVIGHNYIKG